MELFSRTELRKSPPERDSQTQLLTISRERFSSMDKEEAVEWRRRILARQAFLRCCEEQQPS